MLEQRMPNSSTMFQLFSPCLSEIHTDFPNMVIYKTFQKSRVYKGKDMHIEMGWDEEH